MRYRGRRARDQVMSHAMGDILCEPVELTEFELDAVAGGNPFSQNGVAVALSQEYENINVGQIGVEAVVSAISFGNG